ncbi:peroxiredoxin [Roseiconus lacunae]|uniref:peroxiredoxin n=1 Tax=Roseiconus lacunae TaxID=2605694 RepID=UPI0030851476|nr:peroxiredoxin [Stieleria sp. HD01]
MKSILTSLALTLALCLNASAVEVGDKAPSFKAKADSGELWKSSEHVGKKILVVYFYPADMTGGCTKQACGYRDKMKDFSDAGVEVIGVSGDTVENHKIFKDVHDLNFTLLADTDGSVAKAFGVPVSLGDKAVTKLINNIEKELVRKATAKRWTFVIDLEGNIAYKDSQVKAAQDPEKIAAVIAKLK